MRRTKPSLIAAYCSVAVLVTVSGCSGRGNSNAGASAAPDNKTKTVHIAFFLPIENGFSAAALDGSKQAAAANGGKVDAVYAANGSVTTQEQQIQDAVTSERFNALVIYPLSPAVASVVEQAARAGLKVATVEAAITPNPLLPGAVQGGVISTAEPLGDRADALAQMIIKACERRDPCNVAYLYGIVQNPSDGAVFDAMKAILARHPSIRIVATGQGEYAAAPAKAAAAYILEGHPGVNVFATNDDDMTLGVQEALQSAGLHGITLIGVGASVFGCQKVLSGQWFGTTNSAPRMAGYEGTLAVIRAVRSGKSGLPQNWEPLEELHMPVAVTAANAKACAAQWSG
jgi:ribose transport system substrate-binding protein